MYSEQYKRFAKNYGGIFEVDQTNSFQWLIFGYVLELVKGFPSHWKSLKNKNNEELSIEYGYLNNDSFNAVASRENDIYLVGVNQGFANEAFQTFSGYLSHPRILENYGNSDKEEVKFKISYHEGVPFCKPIDEKIHIFPNDRSRVELALVLQKISVLYVFFHEFGHICMGHLGYLKNKFNAHSVEEDVTSSHQFFDVLQSLEIDADIFSMSYLFELIGNDHFELFNKPVLNELSRKERISLALFSIGTVLKLFQYKSVPVNTASTHPKAATRFVSFIRNFLSRMQNSGNLDKAEHDYILFHSIKWLTDADNVFNPKEKIHEWFVNHEGFLSENKLNVMSKSLYKELLQYEFIPHA